MAHDRNPSSIRSVRPQRGWSVGEYKMDLNTGNTGASQPQSQSQSQSLSQSKSSPPSQPHSPDESGEVDMASIGDQSSDPGEKTNSPPPNTVNGQAKKPNAKDPLRPRRKKARRACYACQRAHLTCGRCSIKCSCDGAGSGSPRGDSPADDSCR